MNEFFTGDTTGVPFQLFGVAHILALSVVALINLGLLAIGQRMPVRWRPRIRYGLAMLLLIDEALWHLWNWTTGQWSVQTTLPFHLCSVLVFVSAIMLITKSYPLFEVVYLLGIAGASQALLTPDAGPYGFPHFRFFQVFVSHGSIVAAAVYMAAVEGYRPYPKSLVRVTLGSLGYMALVGVINALLGSNYLYIARKPATASLLDVLPPWPYYLPILVLIGLVMEILLYLPFAVRDFRARAVTRRQAA